MKDLAILSSEFLLLILVSLKKPQQSICSRICLTLAIVNLVMVSREFLGLADLFRAQAFCIHETMKIIVVRKDENLILATIQIVTPRFEGLDNSQKLNIVGLIPSLYRNHFPGKKGY